jgi:hypothetical protein
MLRLGSTDSGKRTNHSRGGDTDVKLRPVVDGTLIRQLPDLEFASGNVQKGIESIIVTHVSDEATAFVADNLRNNKTFFEASLVSSYGNNKIKDAIMNKYPAPGQANSKYKDEKARMADAMATGFFTCHVRTIANAFKDKVWIAQYSRGLGKHGMDLQANFYNASGTPPREDPGFSTFAPAYQNYMLSHARSGDPNKWQIASGTEKWPKATLGPVFGNVLEAGNKGYTLIKDDLTSAETCDFWLDVWAGATKLGGESFNLWLMISVLLTCLFRLYSSRRRGAVNNCLRNQAVV